MDIVCAVIIFILAIVLFIVVNLFFNIVYFGVRGISLVFIGCVIASIFIVGCIMELLTGLIGGIIGFVSMIFSIIFMVIKWSLIIGVILMCIAFLYSLYKKWKESNGCKGQLENQENFNFVEYIKSFNRKLKKKGLVAIGGLLLLLIVGGIYLNRESISQESQNSHTHEKSSSEEVNFVQNDEMTSGQEDSAVQQLPSGKYMGIELVQQYDDIEGIQVLSDNRILVKKEDSYSIYDETFNELTTLGDIEISEVADGFILYNKKIFQDGEFKTKYGILDCDGNVLLEPSIGMSDDDVRKTYTSFIQNEIEGGVLYTTEDWETGLVGVQERGNEGTWILTPVYSDIEIIDSTTFAFKDTNGKWGVTDCEGNIILEPNYSSIEYKFGDIEYVDFTDEYPNESYFVIYNDRGEKGIFTLDGWLFEPQVPYESEIMYFNEHAIVQDGATTNIYNESGNLIKQFEGSYRFTNVVSLSGIESSYSTEYHTACSKSGKCAITSDEFDFIADGLTTDNNYILDSGIFVSISEPYLSNTKQFEFFNTDGSLIERVVASIDTNLTADDIFFGATKKGDAFIIGNNVYRFIVNPKQK